MSRDHSHSSNDLDQFEMIEEQIKKKVDQITDMKQLNKVNQMSDDHIFNNDELITESKTPDATAEDAEPESLDEDDEDDDDEDFECDIERYVKFDDKIDFAEKLK